MLQKVSEFRNRKPFQPFAIVMADGKRFDVEDQLQLAVSRKYVVYVFRRVGGHTVLNESDIVAVESASQVASI